MKKCIGTVAAFLLFAMALMAQPPNLDTVKAELYKVNKVFDSSRYLGFDVTVKYTSDTVYGKFDYEEMKGRYILSDKNVYYQMGATEYVQNDSFTYTIYNDEQMLIMTRDSISAKSSLFPLKEFVDSVVNNYAASYTLAVRYEDESKVIEFTTTDTLAPYQRFAIYYEPQTYYPDKFELFFKGNPEIEPNSSVDLGRQQRITMSFSNYNHPNTLDVFDDVKYVFFDRLHKKYRPAEKFKAYKFIANGVDGGEYDESVELYPPPADQ